MLALLANWRIISEGIVAAILVVTIGVLMLQRDHARADLSTEKQNVAVLTSANAAYAAQVAHQNAAIDQLRAQTLERERAAQRAIYEAEAISIIFDRQAAVIAAAQPGADLCTSANQLIDRYLK